MEHGKIGDMVDILKKEAGDANIGEQEHTNTSGTAQAASEEEHAHSAEVDETIATRFVPNVPYENKVSVDGIDDLLNEVSSTISVGMDTVDWVGSINYLLSYIVELQSTFKLTLPLSTLGVSTEMFRYVPREENGLYRVGKDLYELIEIDGDFFMSCMTAPIDVDRFKSIVQELLCNMNEGGEYKLRRAGYRILTFANNPPADATGIESDVKDRALVYALNLNSYEIQALCRYASALPGITITNEEDKDHGAILRFVLNTEKVE